MAYIGSTYSQQLTTPAIDYFNGNGVTTTFQLSRAVTSVNDLLVVVNNVPQNPREAYGITSTNQIAFTSAPTAGTNNIYVIYNSQVGQTVTPSPGTVGTSALAEITNIRSSTNNFTLQTGGDNTTALIVDQNQNIGLGGTPGTFNLNPRLLVRGPWADPTATGSYGGLFVTTTDAIGISANRGGTISLGGVYNASGDYTRFAAIEGNKNNSTDGDYGGYLSFFTRPNGSAPVERVRINSNGYVTAPFQPSFYVWSDIYTPQRTYNSQVIFNTANTNGINLTTNVGSHFVASTGRFTAPVAGVYSFVGAFSRSAGNAIIDIFKNGSSVGVRHLSYGADWQTATASAILSLAASDYVELSFGGTNGTTTSGYRIHFMGQLIG